MERIFQPDNCRAFSISTVRPGSFRGNENSLRPRRPENFRTVDLFPDPMIGQNTVAIRKAPPFALPQKPGLSLLPLPIDRPNRTHYGPMTKDLFHE